MNKILTASNSIRQPTSSRRNFAETPRLEGITTSLKNENLQSGVGELPFVEMWPELWLLNLHDLDRARQVLNEFVNGKLFGLGLYNMQRANPGSFEICWMCAGTSIDDEDNLTA